MMSSGRPMSPDLRNSLIAWASVLAIFGLGWAVHRLIPPPPLQRWQEACVVAIGALPLVGRLTMSLGRVLRRAFLHRGKAGGSAGLDPK